MIVSLYPGRPFQSIIIPLSGICWQSYDMWIVSLKFKRCFKVSTFMNYEASSLVSLRLLTLSRLKFWNLLTCDLGSLSPLNIELRLRGRLSSDCSRTPRATRTCPLNIQTSPKQPQLLLFSLYTFRKSVANSFSMKIHSLKHEWK